MTAFRERAALELGMQAVLAKQVALADGFPLLVGSSTAPVSGTVRFHFVKANLDELMEDHPAVFGRDLGMLLPYVGFGFCDTASRAQLQARSDRIAIWRRLANVEGGARTRGSLHRE